MVGKAKAKISFIVCYYILMGTVSLTAFIYFEIEGDSDRKAIKKHFICQSTGMQDGQDCGQPPYEHLETLNSLSALATIVLGLLPAVVVVLTAKCECRNKCLKRR